MAKLIKLVSSQDEIFEVLPELLKCSGIISTFLKEDGYNEEALPLPKVSSSILRKVLSWAKYHRDDPQPKEDGVAGQPKDITPWDADFIKVDKDTLIDLVAAADYLDIPGLWNLSSQAMAKIPKDKSKQD